MGNLNLFEPDVETKKATFAMSWFWFPEAQYGCAPGIIRTRVGFTGGKYPNPTYKNLGDHTETVDVDYDPNITSYEALLKMFWKNHNPSACAKRQYMSAIFYHDEEQKSLAEIQLKELQKNTQAILQTEILKAETFYEAELYHQKYFLQNHKSLCESLGLKGSTIISSHAATRINGYVGGFGKVADFEDEWQKLGITEEQMEYIKQQIVKGNRGDC